MNTRLGRKYCNILLPFSYLRGTKFEKHR